VDRLQGHALSAVVNYFIEAIESGSAANGISLEIFPKVLSSITSHSDDFIVEGGNVCGCGYTCVGPSQCLFHSCHYIM
jgi:hypothetical protein